MQFSQIDVWTGKYYFAWKSADYCPWWSWNKFM